MAKNKKKEQEPLVQEQEEVVESGFSIETFIDENKNLLLGVVGGLILIFGGLAFYNFTQKGKNKKASEAMFRAVQYFEQENYKFALDGDGTDIGLYDIESEYGGTESANLAKYYIGVIYLSQDTPDVDLGIQYLKDFDKRSGSPLSMAAYMALGFAHEDLGDPGKAADYFESAVSATGSENEATAPTLLMHVARNYETAGEPDKALRVYKRIKKEFPLSQEGRNIEKYIGRVSNE